MELLSIMPDDNFKVGDYIYLLQEKGTSVEGITGISYKRKLTVVQAISIKLGISLMDLVPSSICEQYCRGYVYLIVEIGLLNYKVKIYKNGEIK